VAHPWVGRRVVRSQLGRLVDSHHRPEGNRRRPVGIRHRLGDRSRLAERRPEVRSRLVVDHSPLLE